MGGGIFVPLWSLGLGTPPTPCGWRSYLQLVFGPGGVCGRRSGEAVFVPGTWPRFDVPARKLRFDVPARTLRFDVPARKLRHDVPKDGVRPP